LSDIVLAPLNLVILYKEVSPAATDKRGRYGNSLLVLSDAVIGQTSRRFAEWAPNKPIFTTSITSHLAWKQLNNVFLDNGDMA